MMTEDEIMNRGLCTSSKTRLQHEPRKSMQGGYGNLLFLHAHLHHTSWVPSRVFHYANATP